MIEIVPYRESWPAEFAAIAAELRALGGKHILAIHHIGSTAVPGLAAKDVIDLQVTVVDIAAARSLPFNEPKFIRRLDVQDHNPPGMSLPPEQLEKCFYKTTGRAANIHARIAGRFNQRYPLLCRDYLRAHPAAANAYAAIKIELARLFPEDMDSYYAIKDPVFDLMMAQAEEWAAQTAWSAPPSD
ncbi:MAG TPA: GrpB family protein [Rhizomicrobium sp.]|jgi:GrpB-like predicted nucleotidyltransferase (UPF0157 family)|nr:GrpB family protein [Rhizomicrobium sp.]